MRASSDCRASRVAAALATTLAASGFLLAALTVAGQQQRKPASKADLIGLLEAGVSSSEIEKLVRDYGVSFELTPEAEGDLRKAGATDDLIKAVRAAAPKPAAPPVLEIQSTPGHAQVYVDDAFSGQTSDQGRLKVLNLAPGNHRVRLAHDGYHDYERAIELPAGQTASFTATLEAAAPPPAPTVNLTVEPTTVEKGQSVTLSWSSDNATELDLQPGVGRVAGKGSTTLAPSDSTSYTLTAKGPGGTASSTARLTVTLPPPPPPPPIDVPVIEERFDVLHTGGRSSLHQGRGELVVTNRRVKYESRKDRGHQFDVALSEVTNVEVGARGSGEIMFQRPLILWVRGEKYFFYVKGGRGPEDALTAIQRAKGER